VEGDSGEGTRRKGDGKCTESGISGGSQKKMGRQQGLQGTGSEKFRHPLPPLSPTLALVA